MKTSSGKATITAGLMVAFLAALAVGWHLAGSGPGSNETAEAGPARTRSNAGRPVREMGTSARQRMAALRAISDPAERLRATHALVCSLSPSELAKWLEHRWFDSGPGYDATLFNEIARQRMQHEDPDGFLALMLRENRGQAAELLTQLAKNDPQRARNMLREHPDPEMEMRMLSALAASDPKLALDMLLESHGVAGDDGFAGSLRMDAVSELARRCPNELEAALPRMTASLRHQVEAALIGVRLVGSFGTEIRKLWARPDGWKLFETALRGNSRIGEGLVDEIANLPSSWRKRVAKNPYQYVTPKNLETWATTDLEAAGFTKGQAEKFRMVVASRLAVTQPEEAIRLACDFDSTEDNKRSILASVFARYRSEPEKAERLLAMLSSDEDRAMARRILIPEPVAATKPESASPADSPAPAKIEQPADWLAKASEMGGEAGGMNSSQILSLLQNWDAERLSSLANQFKELPQDQKRKISGILIADFMTEANLRPMQAEAIRFLIGNPLPAADGSPRKDTALTFNASRLAVSWVKDDPVAASDWVRSLPAGDARQWAQKNLAANWWKYDPDAVNRWIDSLPAADRGPVRESLKPKAGP